MTRSPILTLATALLVGAPALAHAPIIACYDEGDDTIYCEAGYSDGASSEGQVVRVMSAEGRLLIESAFNAAGAFLFDRPDTPFFVEFVGDGTHQAVFHEDELY